MIATGVRWDESKNRASRWGCYEVLMKNKADRVILSDDDMSDMQTEKDFKQLTIPGVGSDLMLMNDNSKKESSSNGAK